MSSCPGDLQCSFNAPDRSDNIKRIMKNGSAEGGDGEDEIGNELGEPPQKKKCLEKENVTTSSAMKKRGRKRKPLKEYQVRL